MIRSPMSPLSIEDVNTILTNKLKRNNFELVSCQVLEGDVPTGFLSATEKQCIKYKRDGYEEKLNLFIKKLPEPTFHRNLVISSGGFRKEVEVFEKFLNELKSKIQGDFIPTCYLGRPDEILALKDLSCEGFSNVPTLETFSLDHCEKASESLAKIHAASLLFEIKKGCKINEYIPLLKEETIFSDDENLSTTKGILVGLEAVKIIKNKYIPQNEEELKEKVFKYMSKTTENLRPSTKYPNVLSHSDLWANNIIFRYNNQGKVAEACILDFQVTAYRPLAYDILMLVYLCTDKELRDKHLRYLLQHYYNTLSDEMSSQGVNLSGIITWIGFEEMVNELRPVLLALAPQMLHFVMMPDYIVKDVLQEEQKWIHFYEIDRSDFALKAAEECIPYRNRVVGALIELFEYFRTETNL